MLLALKIDNIAVIESASLELCGGLNVLTGETGAGKSIVIDSINAILGERTSKELIRDGADRAVVVAQFADVDKSVSDFLTDEGIPVNDDASLIISRSISLSGKNICRVNDVPVSVTKLKELGAMLVNIHGQHDSQALLIPEKHCSFIDTLADNGELRSEYKASFKKLIAVKKELDALYDTRDEKAQRLDYLDFVIKEISDADLHTGEADELAKEKAMLENSVLVRKNLEKSYLALSGDNGISEALMNCATELENAARFYADAVNTAKAVKNMAFELGELTSSVRELSENFRFRPERIKEIDDRLDVIYRLSMKYGKTEADILKFLDDAVSEKENLNSSDERIAVLENELYEYGDRVKLLSEKLTESRKKTSEKFQKQVCTELEFLDMPNVRFVVDIKETPLNSKGKDNIEFLISANAGQEPKPIAKIASGGELSRIMLAIKTVLSGCDNVGTLIFDEIDSGVSGSAAEKIALKLNRVSKGRQVICVTHLGIIAAAADNQMKIEKSFNEKGTFTKVIPLDFEGRANEIARINAGNSVTELQLQSAREMLKNFMN